jgi:hypothetical protein
MGGVRVSVEGEGVGPFELCIFQNLLAFCKSHNQPLSSVIYMQPNSNKDLQILKFELEQSPIELYLNIYRETFCSNIGCKNKVNVFIQKFRFQKWYIKPELDIVQQHQNTSIRYCLNIFKYTTIQK